MTNKYAEMVKEFNDTFCPEAKPAIYTKLILEEFVEWFNAKDDDTYVEKHELKELCDLMYVVYGYAHTVKWTLNINEQEMKTIKGQVVPERQNLLIIASLGEFLGGKEQFWLENMSTSILCYAQSKRWDFMEAFTRVHESNMSKLEDGKVVKREDGKVLKGKNYKEPNLNDLIAKPKKEEKRRVRKIKF